MHPAGCRGYAEQRGLAGSSRDAPPILFRLAEKERAAPGGRKRRFWPLYTKADGRFLRRCFLCPDSLLPAASDLGSPGEFSAAKVSLGQSSWWKTERPLLLLPRVTRIPRQSRRTAAHGPVLSRPSTAAVGRSEAERPGPTRRGLSVLHPVAHPSPGLRRSSIRSRTMFSAAGRRLAGLHRRV